MRVDQFDFELPQDRIALRPAVRRDASRLLVVSGRRFDDRVFKDLPGILRPGDLLVLNDTKVMPVALTASRAGRAQSAPPVAVELTLYLRAAPDRWLAFARPARRLRPGDVLSLSPEVEARILTRADDGSVELRFSLAGAALDAALAAVGRMPLPPYIASKRPADGRDREDYQTVFAKEPGAVAAPTAGLHFSPETFAALAEKGVSRVDVTLHVGPGTFLPVKVEDSRHHVMQAEWGHISPDAATRINRARAAGGRIVAVGTTSLRLLESAADENGRISAFNGETDLFITPGYRFRTAEVLLTNFHQPRSTLFMLVSAFAGLDTMKAAYTHAIEAGYRFYSYGDATLLYR